MRIQVVGCKERKGLTKDGKAYHFYVASVVVIAPDGTAAVGELTRDAAVQPGNYQAELEPYSRDGKIMFAVSELKPIAASATRAA